MKMVRSMMTMILAVGRNIKWTMTLNLCLMPLNKTSEIKYTYGYLNQPMAQNIVTFRSNIKSSLLRFLLGYRQSFNSKNPQVA